MEAYVLMEQNGGTANNLFTEEISWDFTLGKKHQMAAPEGGTFHLSLPFSLRRDAWHVLLDEDPPVSFEPPLSTSEQMP